MPLETGDSVSVMVNSLGATPKEELLIAYRRIHQVLSGKGVRLVMPHIGEFATSMEMAGLSVTLFKLDAELEALLRAPASNAVLHQREYLRSDGYAGYKYAENRHGRNRRYDGRQSTIPD